MKVFEDHFCLAKVVIPWLSGTDPAVYGQTPHNVHTKFESCQKKFFKCSGVMRIEQFFTLQEYDHMGL